MRDFADGWFYVFADEQQALYTDGWIAFAFGEDEQLAAAWRGPSPAERRSRMSGVQLSAVIRAAAAANSS